MTQDRTGKLSAYLQILRPTHWVKNSFVLAPLLFSGKFRDFDQCVKALIATISFCLISSAVYIFNDLCDRKEDQQHPEKKHRPLASGTISTVVASNIILILVILVIVISIFQNARFFIVVLIYIGLNALYSLGLKHVAILDVMIIAAGFVLRILGGSVALEDVEPSHWLILCTIMISLFLGFTKRRTELDTIEQAGETTRKVLQDYSVRFLDQAIAMVTAATFICYALYTVDDLTVDRLNSRAMLITVPSVIYGLFRYIYLIYHKKAAADPATLVCRDVPTLINLVLWIILCYIAVSFGNRLDPFQ
jgi:4-hydroxybenzoate polyprenyltransferase